MLALASQSACGKAASWVFDAVMFVLPVLLMFSIAGATAQQLLTGILLLGVLVVLVGFLAAIVITLRIILIVVSVNIRKLLTART